MGKLNIELFKKVREKIATTPEAYDQETYGRRDNKAPCGTAACIAGWACVLGGVEQIGTIQLLTELWDAGDRNPSVRVPIKARTLLGLTDEEADVLFRGEPEGEWLDYDESGNDIFHDGWPEPFASNWRHASPAERPFVAVAYLDHIIETGKVLE